MTAPGYRLGRRIVAKIQGLGRDGDDAPKGLPSQVASRVRGGYIRLLVEPMPLAKTVGERFIVCLLDRVAVTSLRDHLAEEYAMTEDHYRDLFGLPSDYPWT
jgi:predicted transcriptional regulator